MRKADWVFLLICRLAFPKVLEWPTDRLVVISEQSSQSHVSGLSASSSAKTSATTSQLDIAMASIAEDFIIIFGLC